MIERSLYLHAWYQRAQTDYAQQYITLYVAFNAWYRSLTGKTHDRVALNVLQRGIPLWEEYREGNTLQEIRSPMRLLVELTQREPLSYATPHWKGEVAHIGDWTSLIEYWYRVRCLVVHGSEIQPHYVYLAYETLNIFMGEVIRREQQRSPLLSLENKV